MRKIEQSMLNAVKSMTNWGGGNTTVIFDKERMISVITLHGNHIADYCHNNSKLIVNVFTLGRWPTSTTKSRLRALGADITTKKGIVYCSGYAISQKTI